MTRSEFIDIASEEGWDRAVAQCNIETNDRNLKVLCSIYYITIIKISKLFLTAFENYFFNILFTPEFKICKIVSII